MRRTDTRRRAFALSLSLTFALAAPVAFADDTEQARILYQKANVYFKKEDDVMAREFYRQSWELRESFDTICNYGRSEARSKLWNGAYEKLGLCLYLYPKDKEFASNRQQFSELREQTKLELDVDEVDEIDARLKLEIERREREAAAVTPTSGLEAPAPTKPEYSPLRLPVSIAMGSLGVAGLGVGAGFWVHSGAKKGKAEDLSDGIAADGGHCVEGQGPDPDCDEVNKLRDSSDQAQHIAIGGLAAGGALIVGGVLTYFLWPESKVAETARPVINFERDSARWTFGFQAEF